MKACVFFIAVVLHLQSFAQQQALTVGDTLDFGKADQISDHTGKIINTDKLKGKHILLDFWSTWCVPCVASFPKLDGLQKKFEGQLSIYPITHEDKSHIGSFWESNKITRNLSIRSIVADSFFHPLFPHRGVPHVVWIDRNGVVQAITTSQYINEENIERFLKGDELDLPIKDHVNRYDFAKRLTDQPTMDESRTLTVSVSDAISATPPSMDVFLDTVSMTKRYLFINQPILNLYRWVLEKSRYQHLAYPARMVLLTRDSSRFIYSKDHEYFEKWLAENAFCVELNVSDHVLEEEAYVSIIHLINIFCGLDAGIKNMEVDCLEIIGLDSMRYERIVANQTEAIENSNKIILSKLVESANRRMGNPPILIGKSSLSQYPVIMGSPYYIGIPSEKLEKILVENGFIIRKQKACLDMFVIKEH